MTDILEIDSELRTDAGGIKLHRGAAAINEKLKYWFEKIQQGEVWGRPDKGNPLRKYQFRDSTEANFALMEMEITDVLPDHIPIRILAIRCAPPTAADRFTYVQIVYQSLETNEAGVFQGDIVERKG